jgi:peroxiredoxin
MRVFFLLLFFLPAWCSSFGQSIQMNEKSVVKDSTGKVYPFEAWRNLYWKGNEIKAVDINNPKTEFLLIKLSETELEKKLASLPKPRETSLFKTGEKIKRFSATDIEGNKIDLESLKGKIVLLNFWFIHCAPCRIEMPDLNELVDSFKTGEKIVFISIALDSKEDLQNFLKTSPFKYKIIGEGGNIAAQYGVGSYPTHIILNKDGEVFFHTSGLAMNTIYWLKKSIRELLNEDKNKTASN